MESESMGPCREKYWEELNSDEKLERMRNEVKGFMRQVEDLAAKINNLDHHVHLDDNTLAFTRDERLLGRQGAWRGNDMFF